MCASPSLGLGFTFRRFALFAIGLSAFSSLFMAMGGGTAPLLILRLCQGLASGFSIPLLMTIALKVLGPEIRIYGLTVYALTATFFPNLSISVAALWTDGVGDFHWIFYQVIPLCAVAAACVWWGMEQDEPQWARLKQFDWPGVLLVATGFGSLSILLEQGDRLDWYNSPLIWLLSGVSAVAIPAFIFNETVQPVPLVRFDLLKRPNFLYAVITLLVFLVVSLSASTVPLTFLEQVRGYRPLQAHLLTLEVALLQLILLPLTAILLDHKHVDGRWVNLVGFLCILGACFIGAHVTSNWVRDQFYLMQALQAVGFAFVVMPLLVMATNSLKPEEGPFGSALFNTPRAVAEAFGVWTLELITRWRGGLHRNRIVDVIGQNSFVPGSLGIPAPPPGPDTRGIYGTLNQAVQEQVTTLTTIDSFIILGMLVIFLICVLAVLPVRTYPPRIELAKK
jgi:DHA2 family multidrug resistance protein